MGMSEFSPRINGGESSAPQSYFLGHRQQGIINEVVLQTLTPHDQVHLANRLREDYYNTSSPTSLTAAFAIYNIALQKAENIPLLKAQILCDVSSLYANLPESSETVQQAQLSLDAARAVMAKTGRLSRYDRNYRNRLIGWAEKHQAIIKVPAQEEVQLIPAAELVMSVPEVVVALN